MKKKLKKIGLLFSFTLLLLLIWNYQLVSYGIGQGWGQAKILWNAQSVEEALKSNTLTDSLKKKLMLIQEVKQFAEDSLGINKSKNYTTFYDQKGKTLLWIVTACPPYQLKAHEWTFGFLGKFSYKGHFNFKNAQKDSIELAQKGYDADISEVSAWSTLGWFKDPILSSMLKRSEGDLTNLIIHELTHGTLYVKNDVDFNENLASFIGDKGALLFLEKKFGKNSHYYQNYLDENHDDSLFYEYILRKTTLLNQLYEDEKFKMKKESEKKIVKQNFISKTLQELSSLPFRKRKYDAKKLAKFKPNNTFFMGYLRYRAKQNNFEEELQENFGGNLKKYLHYLKQKYPSL
ncbi:MAG: aminopeptidase [Thermonemataceae bacterium]|nr:aminopeptidase [Thermonemataceae bacterium]